MKLCDHIENAEEPLDTILPIDNTSEMQKHFGDYTEEIYEDC